MEKLEKAVEKIEPIKKDDKPAYKGLQLIEDIKYSAGTSIKYWM